MIGRAAVLVTLAVLAGCTTGDRSVTVDRTDGLSLDVYVEMNRSTAALYEVRADGTISFGGGRDAFAGRTSWTGDLTDEEILSLRRLMEAHGWFEREPRSTGEPEGYSYEILIRGPGPQERYRVKGMSEDVEPIIALLSTAALRRLEGDLEHLPRANGD